MGFRKSSLLFLTVLFEQLWQKTAFSAVPSERKIQTSESSQCNDQHYHPPVRNWRRNKKGVRQIGKSSYTQGKNYPQSPVPMLNHRSVVHSSFFPIERGSWIFSILSSILSYLRLSLVHTSSETGGRDVPPERSGGFPFPHLVHLSLANHSCSTTYASPILKEIATSFTSTSTDHEGTYHTVSARYSLSETVRMRGVGWLTVAASQDEM